MIQSLVLGCGPAWPRRHGTHEEIFVDCRGGPNVDRVHDLNDAPWPFEDNSTDEIVALHLVEHLQCLVTFMDECHRVLRPGGQLYIVTPEAGNDPDLTHGDPTHVRCYRLATFRNYFTLAEAPKFGYTTRYWTPGVLEVEHACIRFLGYPVK